MSTSRRPFRLKEQPSTTIMHCDRGIRAIQGQDQGYLGIIWIKINNCHFNLPGTVIELLDIECALCHVTGVQFDKQICPYKSAILDFLQKLPFAFAQNVLGRANFALINPPFCGDYFLTDTRQEPAFYVYYFYGYRPRFRVNRQNLACVPVHYARVPPLCIITEQIKPEVQLSVGTFEVRVLAHVASPISSSPSIRHSGKFPRQFLPLAFFVCRTLSVQNVSKTSAFVTGKCRLKVKSVLIRVGTLTFFKAGVNLNMGQKQTLFETIVFFASFIESIVNYISQESLGHIDSRNRHCMTQNCSVT